MKLPRRKFLHLAAGAAALPAVPRLAWAQTYLTRSVRLIEGKLGLEPRMIEVKGEQDYGGAFSAMDDARGQPMILPASPIFMRDRAAIAQALLERRIPSVAAFRENMEAGALISYGFDLMGLFYDIPSYVHQIARGAKPSDM